MRIFSYIIILIFISLMYSCNSQNETLKVGTNVWPGYEPIYITREIGKLDQNKVKLVEFGSASQVIRAYRKNLLNGAGLTVDEVIFLKSLGFDPKIVLIADISNGADVLIVKPYIKSLKDLKGKKIGVENTALGAFFLTRILEKAGLNKEDIIIVPLEVNQHYKAFIEGKVDAVITFEPVKTRLLKKGGKILFDSSKIYGEIVDVFIVEDDFINKNENVVKYFVSSWFEGLNFLKTRPENAFKMIAQREGTSIEEVKKSYEGLILPSREENVKLMASKLKETIALITKILKERNLIDKNFNFKSEELIDVRFVKEK